MRAACPTRPLLGAVLCAFLAACGAGDDPLVPTTGSNADQPPVVTITSPPDGSHFKAGDIIPFAATATDPEDGRLIDAHVSWRVDLHHDNQVTPVRAATPSDSGSVQVPLRLEASPNIWYRIHFSATDSAGHTVEVTRDVLPLTAKVILATQPEGLTLTLDGQPVTGPYAFIGVQNEERDIAAANQVANGRRYGFAGWSDGGAAAHTLSTPSADTTYTATFSDLGPVSNTPPAVSLDVVASAVVGTPVTLTALASDADGSVARVQFFDGSTALGEDTSAPFSLAWTPTTPGVHNLTARATDDTGDSTTSPAVAVTVSPATGSDGEAPVATLAAPTHLAEHLSGTVTVTATGTDNVGVVAMEFQVDGATLGSEDTAAPFEASWDTSTVPPGQHVVRARARDAAGNRSPWASATVSVDSGAAVPQGLAIDSGWIGNLDNATAFVQSSDGRIFVAEQGGRVRVVKNGRLLALPFVSLSVDDHGERGLIGITLHPDFPATPYVYVHYTTRNGGVHNRISRFAALGDITLGFEERLVDLPELSNATNHNGGALHFGADGKLYVGVGDNANRDQAPDLSSPFGKLLRFNADGSIPGDNPFHASQTGLARAIWAYGLRNPFTFAVQPGTGRLYINDVGEDTWEEINLGTAGANFGWPATEGPTGAAGVTAPLFAYRHVPASPPGSGTGGFFLGASIAGGAFYPSSGGSFPAGYRGNYFFGDYVNRFVGRLDAANGNAAYAFATLQDNPVDVLVGQDGALYVLTRGGITRIAPP
jgi:glucose/arabinose dehydrogenase